MAYLSSLAGISPGPLANETEPISKELQAVTTPKQGEWPTYNGRFSWCNRYSALDQINTDQR